MQNSRLPQVWQNQVFFCLVLCFLLFPVTANPVTCPRRFFFFKENKSFEAEVTPR